MSTQYDLTYVNYKWVSLSLSCIKNYKKKSDEVYQCLLLMVVTFVNRGYLKVQLSYGGFSYIADTFLS